MASKREVLMIRQIYKSVMRAATPEDILQVGPGASAEDVKTEWKARSLVVHPDKANGALTANEANAATQKVNSARDELLRRARARPPPATPPRPTKKRPRTAPPTSWRPPKQRRAPDMQRISGVLVRLEGRREFRAGVGYTARFVLNRQDPRWPEIKEVKLFDRTERTAGFDFPSGKSKGDGRLFALSGRVELGEWQGTTYLKVWDDGAFELEPRPGRRSCLGCDKHIDDDKPSYWIRCPSCWSEL